MTAVRSWKYALLASAMLGGCTGLTNGPPPLITTQDMSSGTTPNAIAAVRSAIITDCMTVTLPGDGSETREGRRNRLVSAYMFAADVAYNQYERNLLDSIRENDLGATSASLMLSTVGSVVGVEELARALDVTNSLVTGTHTAIGRDYLLNQTLTTLQTQMRASRNTQRALILRRFDLSTTDWNSCMALSDVVAFEQAGTLNAAIAAAAASAATANQLADRQVQSAIRAELATGPLPDALRAYIDGDGPDNARMITALRAMDEMGLGAPNDLNRLQEIVEDQPSSGDRRNLVQRIIRLERDRNAAAAQALQAALDQQRVGGN